MAHKIIAEATGYLDQRIEDVRKLRTEIGLENGRRRFAWTQANTARLEQLQQAMATGEPGPPELDPPELLPDNTLTAEQQLLEQRTRRLREHAARIERDAAAREEEMLAHAREVLASLAPDVAELRQLLAGLREVRQAVDTSVPGVYPRDGSAGRTAQSVDVIDLLIAAHSGAVVLAPVAATTDPRARVLTQRETTLVPEPLPDGGKLTYGTRQAG